MNGVKDGVVEGTVFGPHIVVLKENLILYKPKLPQRDR
jgi:hypothetical protein